MTGPPTSSTTRREPGPPPAEQLPPTGVTGKPSVDREAVVNRLGRYLLLGPVGQGGMGSVFAAWDPSLDRKVALKVLKPVPGRPDKTEIRRRRLLREARLIAQLSHPNIVPVYDVGSAGEQIYFTMEFVEGVTLDRFVEKERLGFREILSVYIQAGRALAAAHAAGLIHRDFKPQNALLGEDGRVRVLDFGLAATGWREGEGVPRKWADSGPRFHFPVDPSMPESSLPLGWSDSSAESLLHKGSLTSSGRRLGTPAYMAPEQHLGRDSDERSDQFAFSVSLYRALYGQHPFAGKTREDLIERARTGRFHPIPRDRRVPRWVHRVLLRGLAADPARRYSSMDALIADLSRNPTRRWGQRAVALMGGITAGVLLAPLLAWIGEPRPICSSLEDDLKGLWDAPTQARLAQAVQAGGGPRGAEAFQNLEQLLVPYASRWQALRLDLCAATYVRRERSEQLFDRGMACLERGRSALRTIVSLLDQQPVPLAGEALSLAADLTPPEVCADPQVLMSQSPPPPLAIQRDVALLESRLNRAQALIGSGQLPAAEAEIAAVGEAASRLGSPKLQVEVDALNVQVLEAGGRYQEADGVLQKVLERAGEIGDDVLLAEALIHAVPLNGVHLGRFERAEGFYRAALGLLKRIGEEPTLSAGLMRSMAAVYLERGDLAQALERFRAARLASLKALGPRHIEVARAESAIGRTLLRLGRVEEALEHLGQALEITRKQLGPHDPEVAVIALDLSDAHRERGHIDAARRFAEMALVIREAALGPESALTAQAHKILARTLRLQGKPDAARAHLQSALEAERRILRPGDPGLGATLQALGDLLPEQGRLAEAGRALTEAVEIFERSLGPTHPALAASLISLADFQFQAGRPVEALGTLERARTMRVQLFGRDDPSVADVLVQIGRAEFCAVRPVRAAEHLRQALRILDAKPEHTSSLLATAARFTLARIIGRAVPATKLLLEKARLASQTEPDREAQLLSMIERNPCRGSPAKP